MLDSWQYVYTSEHQVILDCASQFLLVIPTAAPRHVEMKVLISYDLHWLLAACQALEEFCVIEYFLPDTIPPEMPSPEHLNRKTLSHSGTHILKGSGVWSGDNEKNFS
ncbi:hypothetical protein D9613_008181 [Agrocybe pediades]|uniref:Uncharacterized protein n=1 Tax=Agrocybe pediades TaxID=84607 RepID=A0A8H4QM39_9AGAR|nr:hypothetical protein D9613_008181 [Agrocybe pediades]